MGCSPCAAKAARRLAQQQNQSAGKSGSFFLVLPNGMKEAFPTELAAREANRAKHNNRGIVRPAK